MDIVIFPGQNARAWAETMINLEARKLINTANIVGGQHLSDGLARIKFMDDIRQFVMQQLVLPGQPEVMRSAWNA